MNEKVVLADELEECFGRFMSVLSRAVLAVRDERSYERVSSLRMALFSGLHLLVGEAVRALRREGNNNGGGVV